MKGAPDFLPPILQLSGTWIEILTVLYSVFERDFKKSRVCYQEIPVYYNQTVLPDGHGKEEGFWHVISRKDAFSGERLIDYRRAERLPWARPMMESPHRPEIVVFNYSEGPADKGIRTYIWLEDYDYVVILQRKKNAFFWVTAYYVDSEWQRKSLKKRYQERA